VTATAWLRAAGKVEVCVQLRGVVLLRAVTPAGSATACGVFGMPAPQDASTVRTIKRKLARNMLFTNTPPDFPNTDPTQQALELISAMFSTHMTTTRFKVNKP
jgi:hypothetical protein